MCQSFRQHRTDLVVIVKLVLASVFKSICISTLPVTYTNPSMERQGYFVKKFFSKICTKNMFLKKQCYHVTLLLICNTPSHPNEIKVWSSEMWTLFMPPNVTTLVQPMDQEMLESLKKKCWHELLQCLLQGTEREVTIFKYLKKITVKDLVYLVAECWYEITNKQVQNNRTNF